MWPFTRKPKVPEKLPVPDFIILKHTKHATATYTRRNAYGNTYKEPRWYYEVKCRLCGDDLGVWDDCANDFNCKFCGTTGNLNAIKAYMRQELRAAADTNCRYCFKPEKDHVEGKCVFAPTQYEAIGSRT